MKTKKTPARRSRRQTTVQIFDRTFPVLKDGRVDVNGHLLTRQQFEVLKLSALQRINLPQGNRSLAEHREQSLGMALDHLLWEHRPTSTAKDWIARIVDDLTHVSHALMALRVYPFYNRDSTALRGMEALNGLRGDLNRVVDSMTHLHTAMAAEHNDRLKLQDMIDRREAFESLRAGGRAALEYLILTPEFIRKSAENSGRAKS